MRTMSKNNKPNHRQLTADFAIIILVLLLLAVFQSDTVFIAMYVLLSAYLVLTQRTGLFFPLATASLVATAWIYLAQDYYAYDRSFHIFHNMNLWPWLAWAWGLFLVCYLYRGLEARYAIQGRLARLLVFSLMFWALLISAETFAYHSLGLMNVATREYGGLPWCDCIHGPGWMQAGYLALGPLYFMLTRGLLLLVSRARRAARRHHPGNSRRRALRYLISIIVRG